MLNPIFSTIQSAIHVTWPIIIISTIVMVSFRLCYLLHNKQKIVIYKELCMLIFGIYILCLFQIVTFQDDTPWATNNFIPFKEILRYDINSRLFFKNVLGNMIMFFPFGLFSSYYMKVDHLKLPLLLTIIASISIECVQLAIGRVFDVDDILLNVLGGMIGYFIYRLLRMISLKLPSFCKRELFLDVLSILVLLCLVLGIVFIIV